MNETNSIYTALVAAQSEFPQIRRDRTVQVTSRSGGSYSFSYATFEGILRSVMSVLHKHKLSLSQSSIIDTGAEFVVSTLTHDSGASLTNRVRVIFSDGGPQAYGSALSYARRYGVTLLLGICADDDDDANIAEGNDVKVHDKRDMGPRPEASKAVPVDRARELATRMRGILESDLDDTSMSLKVLDLHDELNKHQDEYIASADQLSAKERKAWKELLRIGKTAQSAPLSNGRG